MNTLHTAVVQNSAGNDPEANLAGLEAVLGSISSADLIVLPEVFSLRGATEDYKRTAEPIPGPLADRLAGWAKDRQAWLLAGSVMEKEGDEVFNTSVVFNRAGDIVATYRKIHLFEAHLDTGQVVKETDIYSAGHDPVLVDIEGWQCGLSLCYDLRFPELYRHYADYGAQILFAPSNFTQRTGKDHWEVLVRARAIESQCFVVAPNQCGTNPVTDVVSHGHSMIVGPWGEVLAEAGTEETVIDTELNPALLEEIRRRVPALQHRKLGI